MHICVYVYTYMHTNIYVYTHTFIHAYSCTASYMHSIRCKHRQIAMSDYWVVPYTVVPDTVEISLKYPETSKLWSRPTHLSVSESVFLRAVKSS